MAKYSADALLRFSGDDLSKASLEEALFSPSLFADTLVVVEKAHELEDKALELIASFIKRPTPKISLILHSQKALDLPKELPVEVIGEVKPWDKQAKMATWIASYLKEQGVKASAQIASNLATRSASDRFLLSQELDKLITYVGDKKEVTQADVEAICTLEHNETIWQLTDAFLERNRQRALSLLKNLLDQEMSAYLIVRQLRNVCHQALMMLSLKDNGENVQEHFPQLRGKLFEKNFRLAQEAGSPYLTKALLHIDKTELALKDAPFDETLLLMRIFV